MTITIAFDGSGFRTCKEFYKLQVLPHWGCAFPHLVSYTRLVELMPWSLMGLCCFLNTCSGELTGISFIDSTSIEVCHPNRFHSHKVFKDLAGWGKSGCNRAEVSSACVAPSSSVCWYFGFKLHLIINERGEIWSFALTPGNTDARQPVPEMAESLMGNLFGDKGYISQALFEQLQATGLELITRRRKNMKKRMQSRRGFLGMCCTKHGLIKLIDKILLRKRRTSDGKPVHESATRQRAIMESVNDQLKNICQIEHSRHRSRFNFLVNLISGLIAYSYHPKKPCLDLDFKGLKALPPAIF